MTNNTNTNERIFLGQKAIGGRLTAPAEVATSQAGKQFARFTVACDGRSKEAPSAYYQVAYGAPGIVPYLGKGTPVFIEGDLYVSAYIGKDGKAKPALNISANRVKMFGQQGSNAPIQGQPVVPQYQAQAPAPQAPAYTPAPQAPAYAPIQGQPVVPQYQAQAPAPQGQVPQQITGTPVEDDDIPF